MAPAPESIVITRPVLVITGPTAVGKTGLTIDLAHAFNCEIISMDSMQVYRYMDIGTAKPDLEERQGVVHHLIDILDPDQQYSAAAFVADALQAIRVIHSRGKIPLITGGTGLYLRSLIKGLFLQKFHVPHEIRDALRLDLEKKGRKYMYAKLQRLDPETSARVHPHDTQRILRGLEIYYTAGVPWSLLIKKQQENKTSWCIFKQILLLGLHCDRQVLYKRINSRTQQMLEQGLVQEVGSLYRRGYGPELSSMQAIGYRHAGRLLRGACDYRQLMEEMARDTRRYAKRQMTWLRHQVDLSWFDRQNHQGIATCINTFLSQANDY